LNSSLTTLTLRNNKIEEADKDNLRVIWEETGRDAGDLYM